MSGVWSGPLGAGLAALFPAACVGCGRPLRWDDSMALCATCRAGLRPPRVPACAGCGRPMLGVAAGAGRRRGHDGCRPRCGDCRRQPPPWDYLAAAYLYLPPLVGVVRALKFGRAEHLGQALAEPLAACCLPWVSGLDLVTPVPLAWTRLLVRGYNQAEEVARPLAKRLGLPCRRLLRRRPRPRQALLSRAERRRNQRGAFIAGRALRPGMRVLLVDDVMTTGATLAAAATTLRRAGAAAVIAAVVARTPDASWGEPLR